MKKTVIFLAIASGISLAVTGLLLTRQKQKSISPVLSPAAISAAPIQPAIAYSFWHDPLGFSFSYPQEATVDAHPEDSENYAHVEIKSATHPGHLVVWAKDLPKGKPFGSAQGKQGTITSASEWVESDKELANASIIDMTLAGESAKKALLPSGLVKIGFLHDDLLYEVDMDSAGDNFWSGVLNNVSSSFNFTVSDKNLSVQGASDEEPADEEEVVQ